MSFFKHYPVHADTFTSIYPYIILFFVGVGLNAAVLSSMCCGRSQMEHANDLLGSISNVYAQTKCYINKEIIFVCCALTMILFFNSNITWGGHSQIGISTGSGFEAEVYFYSYSLKYFEVLISYVTRSSVNKSYLIFERPKFHVTQS